MFEKLTNEMQIEFAKSIKVGLVSTIDETNGPHITVLSTLMGKNDKGMMLGKFVEGLSKEFIKIRPNAGFLIMNPEKEFWKGTMLYSHEAKEGEDYVQYNNQPLYRYNSYFGINTVYYFDLLKVSDKFVLPMNQIIINAIKVLLKKKHYTNIAKHQVMKPWAKHFTGKLDTLTFLSYIDESGFPEIVPVIQAQSAGSSRILFKNKPYTNWLSPLVKGQKIAILAFSMTMETVLLKGKFSGFDDKGYGYLDISRVYNSMPPVHKYVYPEQELKPVEFK